MLEHKNRKKTQMKKGKRKELTYERKAIEMARAHWVNQMKKAIKERRTFEGLQIVPTASYYDESHGHRPGESNWTGLGFDLHPQVSLAAGGLVLLFIVMTVIFQEQSASFFQHLLNGIGNTFGWLYILAANFFVIAMLLIAASHYGRIRIGGPDALPEFSTFSWYLGLRWVSRRIGANVGQVRDCKMNAIQRVSTDFEVFRPVRRPAWEGLFSTI
jgi:choline/glycine/proline betaine transport protein